MNTLDQLLQLLYAAGLPEKELTMQLGKEWNDIKEEVGIMRERGWVVSLPPYLTEVNKGRRFYITPSGRKEFERRVEEGKKAQ